MNKKTVGDIPVELESISHLMEVWAEQRILSRLKTTSFGGQQHTEGAHNTGALSSSEAFAMQVVVLDVEISCLQLEA